MIRTVNGRAVLATVLVAVVSVLITAAVALPVALRAANADARAQLAGRANLAARALGTSLADEARVRAVVEGLADEGIDTVLVHAGAPDREGLPGRVITEVAEGRSVSSRTVWNGRSALVEGRALESGDGVVLVMPGVDVSARAVLGRLWLALLAGLLAGALAGLLLARRLGRSLRQAADAARQLSAGDRSVRLPTQAPVEVAAVSAALNDLAAALAASERRQQTFLTSISHELRTPLTTVKGYAEALADGAVSGPATREAGATMLAESERLERLVEDLLALARLEADDFPLEFVRLDLAALATDAGASWAARTAAVGVPLRIDVPTGPVLVQTDPGRLRQVLDGLLENALRVVPPGAPIVVAVTVGPDPADGSGHAGLEVRDGGPGLTDDDLAVVFEQGALHARYRGLRKVGSGLGLALAHRLVARLGGRIEAGHAPEGGVRMTVQLPLAASLRVADSTST